MARLEGRKHESRAARGTAREREEGRERLERRGAQKPGTATEGRGAGVGARDLRWAGAEVRDEDGGEDGEEEEGE